MSRNTSDCSCCSRSFPSSHLCSLGVAGVACTSDTLCRDCWGILASRPWPGPPPVAPIPPLPKLRGGQADSKAMTSSHGKRKKSEDCAGAAESEAKASGAKAAGGMRDVEGGAADCLGPTRRFNASLDSGLARPSGSGLSLSPGTLRLGSLEGLHFGSVSALADSGGGGGLSGPDPSDLQARGRSLPNVAGKGASFGDAWEPSGAAAAAAAAGFGVPGAGAGPSAAWDVPPRKQAHRRGMGSSEDAHMSLADSGLGSLESACASGADATEEMQGVHGSGPNAPKALSDCDPCLPARPPLRGMPLGADMRGGTLPSVLEAGAWDLPWGMPAPLSCKAASCGPGLKRGAVGGALNPSSRPSLAPADESPEFELTAVGGGGGDAFAAPAPRRAEGSGTPETLKLLLNIEPQDAGPMHPPTPEAGACGGCCGAEALRSELACAKEHAAGLEATVRVLEDAGWRWGL
ncbi:hypothetical protein WJX81_003742 [Elliptochloris bilobata]|uniref:Uncharacterized protein n=1 Tax=Elliptochloris bilobata TaxID=381761 RepID=A0AAW1SKN7_9CHLO